MEDHLLTRDDFREKVFLRDNHKCIIPNCNNPADDAHHIIERRLWTHPSEKGGYFFNNGVSVCEYHHLHLVEKCVVEPQSLRYLMGLNTHIPKSFDPLRTYDKWGIQLKRPTRRQIKYPSTPYLPNSPDINDADINLDDLTPFLNQPLVMTTKMDGSNVCLTSESVVARNGSTADHPQYSLLKERHATIYHKLIPNNIQIFGEWLFAKHTISYENLSSYLQIFSVYDMDLELFLGWDEVEEWSNKLGVHTVPIITKLDPISQIRDLEKVISTNALNIIYGNDNENENEGIVLRTIYPFPYGSFESYFTTNGKTQWRVAPIAKYVRIGQHEMTDKNWTRKKIIKNKVK